MLENPWLQKEFSRIKVTEEELRELMVTHYWQGLKVLKVYGYPMYVNGTYKWLIEVEDSEKV